MADEKKFLDLEGLKYFTRKLDGKKANLESPNFTGTPTAPNADSGTANQQIATTKFVNDEVTASKEELKSELDTTNEALSKLPKDVQINGASIVDENKVANIPKAMNKGSLGLIKVDSTGGISVDSSGTLYMVGATNSNIDARKSSTYPITPLYLDYAVKSAMTDGKGAEWTEAEKKSARDRLGADGGKFELIEEIVVVDSTLTALNKNAEPNGTPYNFKHVAIEVSVPTSNTKSTTINLYSASGTLLSNIYFAVKSTSGLQKAKGMSIDIYGIRRTLVNTWASVGSSVTYTCVNGIDGERDMVLDGGNITRLSSGSLDFPIGTVIKIYAVRA